jgi:branched-chain amino acid transport system substrate-binding protein
MKRALYLLAGALGALMLATAATGAASETGVTSSQVLIGGTTPLSGNASAYQSVAKGAAAYFRWVNAHGGVNKRKIKYVYKDDGYDPSKTADKTRELVQQDKVFAIFNSLGTSRTSRRAPT